MLAGLLVVLFVLLVVIVSWQVFTREIVNNAAPWTTEAAIYTFVVLALFAAAYVFSERGHIAVEILIEKFSPAWQKVVGISIELIIIFFAASVLILGGSLVAKGSWNQNIATIPLTVGQVYVVMPIAGAIIVFYSIAHIIGILAGVEKPTAEMDMEEAI